MSDTISAYKDDRCVFTSSCLQEASCLYLRYLCFSAYNGVKQALTIRVICPVSCAIGSGYPSRAPGIIPGFWWSSCYTYCLFSNCCHCPWFIHASVCLTLVCLGKTKMFTLCLFTYRDILR